MKSRIIVLSYTLSRRRLDLEDDGKAGDRMLLSGR